MEDKRETKKGRKKAVVKDPSADPPVPKKRGRKPRGGTLIVRDDSIQESMQIITNVILNLKCSLKDLEAPQTMTDKLYYDPSVPPPVQSYENNNIDYSIYDKKASKEDEDIPQNNTIDYSDKVMDDTNMKTINRKLKELKLSYYKQEVVKKSACFWCTCEFDNPTCYIPKYINDDKIVGYGSFCRPECAVSHLFKEELDDALKFERYHLLNSIYCSVYNYKKNIKPAPDPHYLLDKFYGTLSIQEYRKLLSTEHMLLILDKPMTRTMPELHENNDHFINDIYGSQTETTQPVSSSKYKVKRESEKKKGPSKKTLIAEHFGL